LKKRELSGLQKQIKVYETVCKEVDKIFSIVRPIKKLLLCIDGVAPQSKQNQQRCRRFRSAMEKEEVEFNTFDSNCITPGTKFMDNLGKYIDWHIKQRIGNEWGHIEVIFSNEKVPGEGEHKLINYMRKYHNNEESYLVHGMDADLIMLTLGTGLDKIYILRDVFPGKSPNMYLINIGATKLKLAEMLKWDDTNEVIRLMYDFIFMCFTAGNDFLPKIQSVEIIENGIDTLIEIYKVVCQEYGYLTDHKDNEMIFSKKSVHNFFKLLAEKEIEILSEKVNHEEGYFPDYLLNRNCIVTDKGKVLKFDEYVKDYSTTKFKNITEISHKYLQGMEWVLNYYIKGVPNWNWYYDNHYAPLSTNLRDSIESYVHTTFKKSSPVHPLQQLISVLPPKSAGLLPPPFDQVFRDPYISKYSPEEFEIDLTGTKKEWEGIVIIPFLNPDLVKMVLSKTLRQLDEKDMKRMITGKNIKYIINGYETEFKSFYGNIKTYASFEFIDF
jgi:5'-3' exonuclease